MSQGGVKYDEGKEPVDLIPYEALVEIAKVLDFGAKKYKRANWAGGIKYSRLLAASMRHLGKYNSGEDIDSETGISHIAHAACNLVFLLWMAKNRPDMDDRWIKEVIKTTEKALEVVKELDNGNGKAQSISLTPTR